jgi:general secretion pathway protein D
MLARGEGLSADAAHDAILDQRRLVSGDGPSVLGKKLIRQHFLTGRCLQNVLSILVEVPAWSFMKYRISTWAIFAALTLALTVLSPAAHAQSAKKLFKQGQAAEASGDIETAYERYLAAYKKDPKSDEYKASYSRIRLAAASLHVKQGEKLRDQGDVTGGVTEFLRALQIDPSNELAQQEIQATRNKVDQAAAPPGLPPPPQPTPEEVRARDIGSPIELKPLSNEPLTLHTAEDSKTIYQTVGKLAGINVLFDPDYTGKRVQVDLQNVDLYDALRIIGVVSQTFWRPITANTIFVAQDSRTKRTQLEEQAVQTFYLTNVTQQNDFSDVQTALRQLFTSGAKFFGVASQNAIIMRGTPDELLLAQKLISDLDRAKPEVVVDVAVLEVERSYERTIGLQLPQTASVAFQASNYNTTNSSSSSSSSSTTTTGTTTTTNTSNGLTLNNLAHLNGTNFAVTLGNAQANLLLTDSHTRILQNPQVRSSDGQEASLKIGERLPVAQGSYQTGAATAIVSSLVNTQFTYLDIGVNVTIKPVILYDRDVSMKIKIEVSSEGPSLNLGGVNEPIIDQNVVEQTVRLKEGEANMLGGILQKSTVVSLTGTPGLASVPILKWLFSSQDKTINDTEIVFLLIPHVVRASILDPLNTRQLDTGTQNAIELRHINDDTAAPAAKPIATAVPVQMPAQQAVQVINSGRPVSAASAAEAAAAAMQQQSNGLLQPQGASQPVGLLLGPEMQSQKVGSTFQMAVNLTGGTDVFSVPMQLQYDPSKLSLVNVDLDPPGQAKSVNFLGQDGQAVALVHRDDGNGSVAISASRPPGTHGVNGGGEVCVLTFQAKAAGDASIVITKPVVRNSSQQALPATGSRALVHVTP